MQKRPIDVIKSSKNFNYLANTAKNTYLCATNCDSSSVGRASASQAAKETRTRVRSSDRIGDGTTFDQHTCDSSSVGRASASQAEGRGFEPRLSLLL